MRPLVHFFGVLLFFLMLVLPYQFTMFKGGLLVIILLSFVPIIYYGKKGYTVNAKLIIWMVIYTLSGAWSLYYGYKNFNPGVKYFIGVDLLWPILYTAFLFLIDERFLNRILNVKFFILIIILSFGIIAFIEYNFGVFGVAKVLKFIGFNKIDRGTTFAAFHAGMVVSFLYLFPYFTVLFIISKDYRTIKHFVVIILCFVFAFLSGRRVVFFYILLIPPLLIFYSSFLQSQKAKNLRRKLILGLLGFGVLIGFFYLINLFTNTINIQKYVVFLNDAFSPKASDSGYQIRMAQFRCLIESWEINPIFGSGTGANAGITRSNIPGMYELSYAALLFNRGIVGFAIFFLQIFYVNFFGIKLLIKKSKFEHYIIATLIAFNLFLVANATNPYLYSFDHLWVIFFPIILFNIASREHREKMAD